MRVIVVDDNSMMREVLCMYLAQLKHEVVAEAGNGADAIKAFGEKRPDLVLLDLVMPGVTGMEVLESIRKTDPAAKVIIATAVEQETIEADLLRKGAAAILHKPFSSDELQEALKRLL
ncbi:MAG TPA: two-component system response regulator [Elusimicrobia bacterium]|nr:MAG: hypothetical protein A2016_01585 [Elusimicrobia bacterium GWF2_62_30]HBA60676.1 two-component system response regulator [Elusimicrobiota bacterium]